MRPRPGSITRSLEYCRSVASLRKFSWSNSDHLLSQFSRYGVRAPERRPLFELTGCFILPSCLNVFTRGFCKKDVSRNVLKATKSLRYSAMLKTLLENKLGNRNLSYGAGILCDFTRRDGSSVTINGHALPIKLDDGRPVLLGQLMSDVSIEDAMASVRSFFQFKFAFVTCRHLVDRAFATKDHKSIEHGSRLHSVKFALWHEGRHYTIEYDKDHLDVWVPKNEKLDLAILSLNVKGVSASLDIPDKFLSTAPLSVLVEFCDATSRLDWGAKIGFTSKQPWTGEHPIHRTGIVSSNPLVDFQSPDVPYDHIYLLEAQSFSGSSGSPVWAYPVGSPKTDGISINGFSLEKYKPPHLIGIMLGHINNDKSDAQIRYNLPVGLSYCHKLNAVFMLLMGVEPCRRLW